MDGEQTPVYAITFEFYEIGVSRSLLLDLPLADATEARRTRERLERRG
jgi:hypothetical protein